MSAVDILLESGFKEFESRDANGNTPLMFAIREDHRDIALLLLDRIINCEGQRGQHDPDEECKVTPFLAACTTVINAQNNDDKTALDFTLEQNMGGVIVKLIEAGANLKYLGRETALVAHAVSNRNTKLLLILIKKRLKLNSAVFFALKDHVPLRDPVLEGIILQLLSAGADTARSSELHVIPNQEDYDDHEWDKDNGDFSTNALALASRRGLTNIVETLLEHGAPPDLRNDIDQCPLLIATKNGHKEVVRILLSRAPSSVEMEDDEGATALSTAFESQQLGITELLIQEGRFSAPNKFLEHYFVNSVRAGETLVVETILQRKLVDPDIRDSDGRTPLSWAAENGHDAVVKQLLETGKVDADAKDKNRWTKLSCSAQDGDKAVFRQLLDTGKVDADTMDMYWWPTLPLRAQDRDEAVVEQLLDTEKVDADEDTKDMYWWPALPWRAQDGNTDKFYADIKDEDGWTPLFWAACNRHAAVVKLLLDTGKVDADIKDKDGRTPLFWAARNGHVAVVQQLLDTYEGKVL